VALSRVRRLEDLYLFGTTSIVSGKFHEFWKEHERKKKAQELIEKEPTYIEMSRMEKESPFVNRFPFQSLDYHKDADRGSKMSICMHNVAGLPYHFDSVRADFGMMNADILILVETGVKTCKDSIKMPLNASKRRGRGYYGEFQLDNYDLLQMGSSGERGAKNGCALYVSKRFTNENVQFIGDNSEKGNGVYKGNKLCELGMFSFVLDGGQKCIVVYCYNHPGSSAKQLYKELQIFLHSNDLLPLSKNENQNTAYYLIGDFNIDLKKVNNSNNKSSDAKYLGKFKIQFVILIRN